MTENLRKYDLIEWACRILITVNVFVIVMGYISYFQTSYQLISPLIPHDTIHQISDGHMKASLVSSSFFLIGLWLYFFKKKNPAIVFFSLTIVSYQTFLMVFIK